ncbi:MAG: hypothetical protein ACRCWO_02120 [Bosea sp. (in: a-proteobacteria)]
MRGKMASATTPEPGQSDGLIGWLRRLVGKITGQSGKTGSSVGTLIKAGDASLASATAIPAPKLASFSETFVDELRVIDRRRWSQHARERLRRKKEAKEQKAKEKKKGSAAKLADNAPEKASQSPILDYRLKPGKAKEIEDVIAKSGHKPGEPLKEIDDLGLVLTGMCMSGGGIRSAAINMGVTQGMDSLSPPGRSIMIDQIDYLSTVSGGNYMGTCLAALMTQQPSYPFESKTDGSETPETQRLRDYANYLAPRGGWDVLANLLVVVRCILANIAMLAIAVVALAALTIAFNPDVHRLIEPWSLQLGRALLGTWPEALGPGVVGPLMLLFIGSLMIIWTMFKASRGYKSALEDRQKVANRMPWAVIFAFGIMAFEFQPVVLAAMFRSAAAESAGAGGGWVSFLFGKAGYVLTPAALALFAFGQKLIALLKSAVGDAGFAAMAKRMAYKVGLVLLGLSVPLLIWVTYLNLAHAGICNPRLKEADFGFTCAYGFADWMVRLGGHFAAVALLLPVLALAFVLILRSELRLWEKLALIVMAALPCAVLFLNGLLPIVTPALGFLLVVLAALLFITGWFSPNANTLHQLYRDRLSKTFLMEREPLQQQSQGAPPAGLVSMVQGLQPLGLAQRDFHPDDWKISSLIFAKDERDETGNLRASLKKGAGFSPYLLVNTAVNLQADYLNSRGRNADTFTLAPYWSGSDATGYVRTQELERRDPRLTLATGMAISGAAVSANMGGNTLPVITFSLAALNVRLGYWMPNPKVLEDFADLKEPILQAWRAEHQGTPAAKEEPEEAKPWNLPETGYGPWWLVRELFGKISDKEKRIYLTDGGHIENLGLYELTKRRCKAIICVDAEADPSLSFPSLIKAQLMMRVDHGVRMELPWPQIAAASRKANELIGKPEEASVHEVDGPHVAIGRIVYRQKDESDQDSRDVNGVIFYIKSSLTGDESDVLRNYKARNADFPHETTLDQFFSEEQFEVYRALGFHMARGFFSGSHKGAFWLSPDRDKRLAFFGEVREALARLGLPRKQILAIMKHADAQSDAYEKARRPPPPPRFELMVKRNGK